MDVDDTYRTFVGECGRRQQLICGVIFLLNVIIAFHMVFLVIAGAVPEVRCRDYDGYTNVGVPACHMLHQNYCENTQLSGPVFSIVNEWQLICDKLKLKDFAQSVTMGGVLVGALLWGVASDKFGRRRVVLGTLLLTLISGFATQYSSNFEQFVAARFLAGFGTAGLGIVSYVLGSELIGPSVRATYATGTVASFAVGIMIVAGVGHELRDWRKFTRALNWLSILIAAPALRLPESPHWLAAHHKFKECRAVLLHIAQGNGRTVNHEDLETGSAELLERPRKRQPSSSGGLSAILLDPMLRFWTIIQGYSWLCNSAVYYGLTMASASLTSDLFASVALSGAAELPAYVVTQVFVNRIGRKKILCSALLLSGAACMLITLVPADQAHLRVALGMLGKMGVSSSYLMVFVHSAEVFPTTLRTAGMGLCSMCARIGGILSPLITLAGQDVGTPWHYLVFGLMAASAGLACTRLPETFGRELPNGVEDLRRIFSSKPI